MIRVFRIIKLCWEIKKYFKTYDEVNIVIGVGAGADPGFNIILAKF